MAAGGSTPEGGRGLAPGRPLPSLDLETWGERDGLPQNFVTSLAQTADGYLWAGTERGLARFDGVRFTVYDSESDPSLPTSWVTALEPSDDEGLWLGTGDGELVGYRDGTFETVLDDALGAGPVHEIVQGESGTLWMATEGQGLVRWDGEGSSAGTLEGARATTVTKGPAGTVWVGGAEGVYRVEPGAGELTDAGVELPPGSNVAALHVDDGGTLWIGTTRDGLLRARDGETRPVGDHEQLNSARVSVLLRGGEDALWIGTEGAGLFRLREGRVERLPSAPDRPTHLVQDLLEDREGNLWMGLTGVGIGRLSGGVFDNHGMPEGLSMDVALGLRESSDGALWVATPGQGVNRVVGEEVETFRSQDGLGSDFAMSVAEGPEGAIWVGTIGGGVSRLDGSSVETFGPDAGLLGSDVSVVQWDRQGRLWLGYQGQGLQRWLPTDEDPLGESHSVGPGDGLPSPVVTTVWELPDGGLWVGTTNGLARVDSATHSPEDALRVRETIGVEEGLPHGLVTGLYGDSDGSLWVSTMGGLARVRDGEVHAFGREEGLPDMEPMGLVEDREGMLWVGTGSGILRVPRGDLDAVADGGAEAVDVERFGRAEGLRSAEANGAVHPAAWLAEDGSVWIPTMGGAIRADPDRERRPHADPRPVLEGVLAGGARYGTGEPLTLPAGERTVEFRFTAPTFVSPDRVRLRFRLQGFDDWQEDPGDRVARYTDLPPGSYAFQVEASNRDGTWTGERAEVPLEIPHHFHERPAIQAGGALLLVALLGAGYQLRVRRIRQRERELVQLVEEREEALAALRQREEELRQAQKMEAVGRLAGGIAHDFNNLLSVVGMNARLAAESLEEGSPARQELDQAIRAADRAAEVTRQLLQFSRRQIHRPSPVDLNEVVRGVEQMLRRLIRADIALETRLSHDVPTARVDRAGMEQVLVNLIVNARDAMPDGGRVTVKTWAGTPSPHAEEKVLREKHAVLAVEDTGEGMDAETRSRAFEPFFTTKAVGKGSGLGLASVYGIVQQNEGHVEVSSSPGKGTAFRIYLPASGSDPEEGS